MSEAKFKPGDIVIHKGDNKRYVVIEGIAPVDTGDYHYILSPGFKMPYTPEIALELYDPSKLYEERTLALIGVVKLVTKEISKVISNVKKKIRDM